MFSATLAIWAHLHAASDGFQLIKGEFGVDYCVCEVVEVALREHNIVDSPLTLIDLTHSHL